MMSKESIHLGRGAQQKSILEQRITFLAERMKAGCQHTVPSISVDLYEYINEKKWWDVPYCNIWERMVEHLTYLAQELGVSIDVSQKQRSIERTVKILTCPAGSTTPTFKDSLLELDAPLLITVSTLAQEELNGGEDEDEGWYPVESIEEGEIWIISGWFPAESGKAIACLTRTVNRRHEFRFVRAVEGLEFSWFRAHEGEPVRLIPYQYRQGLWNLRVLYENDSPNNWDVERFDDGI